VADVALRVAASDTRAYGDAAEFDVWCAFAGTDLRARPPQGVITPAVVGGTITAVATTTIADVTSASTATVRVAATASTTLADVTGSSTATVRVAATSATTLADVTSASTATVRVAAVVATTLADVTSASTATVRVTATAAVTLGDVTSASTATVAQPLAGVVVEETKIRLRAVTYKPIRRRP
jgi:hypothetical protein